MWLLLKNLLFHLFVLLYEEPVLEHQFGEPCERYRRQTNRWLPWRPRSDA